MKKIVVLLTAALLIGFAGGALAANVKQKNEHGKNGKGHYDICLDDPNYELKGNRNGEGWGKGGICPKPAGWHKGHSA